jgi:hypothetical protein
MKTPISIKSDEKTFIKKLNNVEKRSFLSCSGCGPLVCITGKEHTPEGQWNLLFKDKEQVMML